MFLIILLNALANIEVDKSSYKSSLLHGFLISKGKVSAST